MVLFGYLGYAFTDEASARRTLRDFHVASDFADRQPPTTPQRQANFGSPCTATAPSLTVDISPVAEGTAFKDEFWRKNHSFGVAPADWIDELVLLVEDLQDTDQSPLGFGFKVAS
ncbi:hypothetical protein D9757_009780 [Collybiopsis confluens]|uniref:Uncharacterized protein n=1 Tax=Collybiopsis confluens TaxID=2823264 RepID=A0A8H5M6D3_9AGAR|nr:hypothetical protein D9757_009780 [Collybiopsis confluens]